MIEEETERSHGNRDIELVSQQVPVELLCQVVYQCVKLTTIAINETRNSWYFRAHSILEDTKPFKLVCLIEFSVFNNWMASEEWIVCIILCLDRITKTSFTEKLTSIFWVEIKKRGGKC